ncbi:MAG: hypothetical protein H0U18_16060 [Pyrinomonadaceae bacterium]|nr:hypothetical protein [Pyrinomonadaceae bacterium]
MTKSQKAYREYLKSDHWLDLRNKGGPGGRLMVDHDHKTWAIRGLLCCRCNSVIGYAKDNPETLRNAISYLERNSIVRPTL